MGSSQYTYEVVNYHEPHPADRETEVHKTICPKSHSENLGQFRDSALTSRAPKVKLPPVVWGEVTDSRTPADLELVLGQG